jgi:Rrf2 family iron-sulfur cluster assembly transcriptional regulator
MKLTTKSRYGTRLMLDLAQRYGKRAIQLNEIARRQNISVKYLEQIIRPLKKANYINSFRGSRGGYMLNKPPEEITVGEIVALLEDSPSLTPCVDNPDVCDRVDNCPTRLIWQEATKAMYDKLSQIRFSELTAIDNEECREKFIRFLAAK